MADRIAHCHECMMILLHSNSHTLRTKHIVRKTDTLNLNQQQLCGSDHAYSRALDGRIWRRYEINDVFMIINQMSSQTHGTGSIRHGFSPEAIDNGV